MLRPNILRIHMKKLILSVLEDMSNGPATITLKSSFFREAIANAIIKAIKSKKGWYLNIDTLPKNKGN